MPASSQYIDNENEDDFYLIDRNSIDDDLNLNRSVSQQNINQSFLFDEKSFLNHMERSGLFNCNHCVWKRKDLIGCVQSYKIGQMCDVIISFIDDSRRFYVQDVRRLNDLNKLETCINKYADVLLSDKNIYDELYAFQNKAIKFDVVLARAEYDNNWHRAVYLDRISSKELLAANCDSEYDNEDLVNEKTYHSFFFIDSGREETTITRKNVPRSLFILPLNTKLIQIGCFALKCSINEVYLKQLDYFAAENKQERQNIELLFEKYFKSMLLHKQVKIKLSKMIVAKSTESESVVDLYYSAEDAKKILMNTINIQKNQEATNASTNQFVDTLLFKEFKATSNEAYLKLNCIYYVLKKMITNKNELTVRFFFSLFLRSAI
jgi:hypothetical protein